MDDFPGTSFASPLAFVLVPLVVGLIIWGIESLSRSTRAALGGILVLFAIYFFISDIFGLAR